MAPSRPAETRFPDDANAATEDRRPPRQVLVSSRSGKRTPPRARIRGPRVAAHKGRVASHFVGQDCDGDANAAEVPNDQGFSLDSI